MQGRLRYDRGAQACVHDAMSFTLTHQSPFALPSSSRCTCAPRPAPATVAEAAASVSLHRVLLAAACLCKSFAPPA